MQWLHELAPILSALAWPSTVLVLTAVFRGEVRRLLAAVTELKFPGGSVVLKEVERLETRIQITGESVKSLPLQAEPISPLHPDSRLAIAQTRLDIEADLFRMSQLKFGSSDIASWQVSRHIRELEGAGILGGREGADLRAFVQLSNLLIHEGKVPDEVLTRSLMIGATLAGTLRFRRLVAEAEYDFDGHGIWHMHTYLDITHRKFYFWSAVASMLPEYGYEYDVYHEAALRHLEKLRQRGHAGEAEQFYVLPLSEFVEVLKFREKELLRLIEAWDKGPSLFADANEWHWPEEWGELRWNGPVLRERAYLNGAQQDLLLTRLAIERHQARAGSILVRTDGRIA
jgi:hypothetical protein